MSGRPASSARSYQLGVDLLASSPAFCSSTYVESRPKICARRSRWNASCRRSSASARKPALETPSRARRAPWRGSRAAPSRLAACSSSPEIPERAQLDDVGVPLVRLGEQRQVRVALGLRAPVVGHVHLAADDRLHACIARLPVELDRASERAVVGERDGGHLEALRLLDESRDPARAVEDRVLGVDVQMDEWRRGGATHGTASLVRLPADPRPAIFACYAALPCQKTSARRRQSSRRSVRPVTRWSPVHADESAEIRLLALRASCFQHTQVPGCRIDPELCREQKRAFPQRFGRRAESGHARAIGSRVGPNETVPSEG